MEPYRIQLRNSDADVLIDLSDEPLVRDYKWYLIRKRGVQGYREYRDGRPDMIMLGRLIMGVTDGAIFVDHVNGDPTDNRRANLRLATLTQNNQNRRISRNSKSGFKGVFPHPTAGRWIASIGHQGKPLRIGVTDTPEEAARLYDARARVLYGAFACLNFPEPGERPAR